MKRFALLALALFFLPVTGYAETTKSNFIYGNFYSHQERRDYEKERNFEVSLGFDHLLDESSNLFVGARGGLFREKVLTSIPVGQSNNWPFVGGHLYWALPLGNSVAVKLGGASDVIITGHTDDTSFPVWAYFGGETGIRAYLAEGLYAEIPAEIGFFPFFDGTPWFAKVGFQIGIGF